MKPMPKSLKVILFTVSAFLGLLLLAVAVLLFWVDANDYKARLEAAASSALGMEIRVGGHLGIVFFPGLKITMADLHILNLGTEVVSAKEARFEIDLIPLLRQRVWAGKIFLEHPMIFVSRDRDGMFNFTIPAAIRNRLPALDLTNVFLSDGTLLYANKLSGKVFEAEDCNLDASPLRLPNWQHQNFWHDLSLTAQISCGTMRTEEFVAASGLKLSLIVKESGFELKPLLMSVFGGQGSGSIQADFAGAVPLYHVRYSLSQFRLEEFIKTLSPDKVAAGAMDFSVNLEMQGETVNDLKQNMTGEISLQGKGLTLYGKDLDQEFSRFESSQNFNLVDVGALFFAGPLGLVVTKGYNFASVLQGAQGGSSEIPILVSTWKVEDGVARARDVAMATNENRIALKGGLDFVNERFDEVTVALIDANGCAKVQQKIRGTFQERLIEKPNVLKALAGPVLELLKKGAALFSDEKCEVFYSGLVAPPE